MSETLLATTDPMAIWVQRAQEGDEQAFYVLMERYRDGVVAQLQKRLGSQADAEDLAQLTFTKAFAKIATYSTQYNFSTWLYRIARNCCIDFERKNKGKLISIDNILENEEFSGQHSDLNPEESMIAEQDIVLAKLLLLKLKPHYREIIEMRYLHEYAYDEIAQKLNLPIGTVKTQLFRGKEQLVKLLVQANSSHKTQREKRHERIG